MNRFVAILTILSLIAHAAVGCCAHSVHFATCHPLSTQHADQDAHEASHVHYTDHEHPPFPCESTPGEQHECQHTKCQWIPSSNSVDISVGSPFATDSIICDMIILQPSVSPLPGLAALSESFPGVPLRSHLVLSVLLI